MGIAALGFLFNLAIIYHFYEAILCSREDPYLCCEGCILSTSFCTAELS